MIWWLFVFPHPFFNQVRVCIHYEFHYVAYLQTKNRFSWTILFSHLKPTLRPELQWKIACLLKIFVKFQIFSLSSSSQIFPFVFSSLSREFLLSSFRHQLQTILQLLQNKSMSHENSLWPCYKHWVKAKIAKETEHTGMTVITRLTSKTSSDFLITMSPSTLLPTWFVTWLLLLNSYILKVQTSFYQIWLP